MSTALTQKERIAALKARTSSHGHEHELGDRVWTAKLDAIDQRLRGIERVLLEVRLNPADTQASGWRRLTRRDVGVMSGTAAATTALWWLTELARVAIGA